MFINNAIYKAIPTASLTFPLSEGVVVTVGGVTGIVTENVAQASPTATIYIAVGGTIDLRSEANKGVSFTDAQIKALGSDFNFVPASESEKELPPPALSDAGKVVTVNETGTGYELTEPDSGLPEYDSDDEGKLLSIEMVEGSAKTLFPQQTVTLDEGYASISNANTQLFVLRSQVTIVIDNETIVSYVVNDGAIVAPFQYDSENAGIILDNGELTLWMDGGTGSRVISATIKNLEPKASWSDSPYDVIIKLNMADGEVTDSVTIKSDVRKMSSFISNKTPVLACGITDDESYHIAVLPAVVRIVGGVVYIDIYNMLINNNKLVYYRLTYDDAYNEWFLN